MASANTPARPLVVPSEDSSHGGGLGLTLFHAGRRTEDAQQIRKKKTMKTTSQKYSAGAREQIRTADQQPARKHDAQIQTARLSPAWVDFEAGIHQNEQLRARVARSLDRYSLGSSSLMVDAAVDFLIHKDLGAAALYFNRTGRAIFNQRQVSNAVFTFMSRKEQQRHMSDLTIREDDQDHAEPLPGSIPASHLPDASALAPDELAVRSDARRAFLSISAAIPARDRELYTLLLGLRQSGTRLNIEAYASRKGIGISTVYDRLKKLASAIQLHPMFTELAAAFRPRLTA